MMSDIVTGLPDLVSGVWSGPGCVVVDDVDGRW